jgi:hypothetical protein
MVTTNISFSLTEEYIKSTCKPGTENACRFFSIGGGGFTCEKFGYLMDSINTRVRNNEMRATGDNCNGFLGVIMEHKPAFIGKKVLYEEQLPACAVDGSVKDLTLDEVKKFFTIHIDAGEDSFPFEINLDHLEIEDNRDYIKFGIHGAGSFAGTVKIFK